MKTKYYILLILALNTNLIISQTYLPTVVKGRTWEITKPLGMGQFSTYSLRLACDTIINSMNYLNVISSGTDNFFIREDTVSHKLFKYDSVLGTDKLIIDYDITVGSVVKTMVVDSINYATYFGQMRKVIYFNNLVKWIEGVGNSFNGLSDTLNGYSYVTNVFNSDTTCFPLSTSEIGLNNIEVKQIGSNLYFYNSSNSPIILKIYNLMGQLLNQFTINTSLTLDLNDYSMQLIFLEMTSERKRKVMKVLMHQ